MCHVCNQSDSLFYDNLRDILMDRLESEKIVKTIENLGLLSDLPIKKKGSPIDTVNCRLAPLHLKTENCPILSN